MYIIFTHDKHGNKISYLSTTKKKANEILKELCRRYGEAECISLKHIEQGLFEFPQ